MDWKFCVSRTPKSSWPHVKGDPCLISCNDISKMAPLLCLEDVEKLSGTPNRFVDRVELPVTNPKFDETKKMGAEPACDVCSIGCLFYELFTGRYLFADSNWSRFFLRITEGNQLLLTEANGKELPHDPTFSRFLELVLQRDRRAKPSLGKIISKFDEMFSEARKFTFPDTAAFTRRE
jgi:serine/threonine protein kinase